MGSRLRKWRASRWMAKRGKRVTGPRAQRSKQRTGQGILNLSVLTSCGHGGEVFST